MVVIASPFLFFALKDFASIPQINSSEYYTVDPLNFLIPTHLTTHLGRTLCAKLVNQFDLLDHGGFDAYLGLPLILILILQLRDIRKRPYLKPLMVSLLVMVVLSLGPTLRLGGIVTNIWLPWRLALHLPLIHQALPFRFSMYVEMVAAVAVALWLSVAKPGWDRMGRFGLAVVACLWLVPNRAFLRHWTPLPVEPFFEPQNILATLGTDANVLILPFAAKGPGMIWQWQSGMRFTQSGGYIGYAPPSESAWPVIQNFYSGTAGPNFGSDIAGYCVVHHISAILVGPGTPPPLGSAMEALPWPQTTDHGVRVVRVPDSRLLHYHYILGDYWFEGGPYSWMGRQVTIVTHGQPVRLSITGRYRPSEVGPVEITVANGSEVSRYHIAKQDTKELSLPADASVTLTASATWLPLPDQRALSVAIALQPEKFE
jgi:hypothetical protein